MLLYGASAFVGLVVLNRLLKDSRPLLVSATKEVIAFQERLSANMDENKEFWEDVVAEVKHPYKLEIERRLEILQKQQEALQRIKQNL
jgi:hypothetical protein